MAGDLRDKKLQFAVFERRLIYWVSGTREDNTIVHIDRRVTWRLYDAFKWARNAVPTVLNLMKQGWLVRKERVLVPSAEPFDEWLEAIEVADRCGES